MLYTVKYQVEPGIDSIDIDSIDSIDIARRRTRLRPQDRVALHLTN